MPTARLEVSSRWLPEGQSRVRHALNALRLRVPWSTLRRHPNLAERLSRSLTYFRLQLGLVHCEIVLVHVLPWQVQELVLVLPSKRILLEFLGFGRRKRWFSDLCDEIRG
jgi:hypothetical protein